MERILLLSILLIAGCASTSKELMNKAIKEPVKSKKVTLLKDTIVKADKEEVYKNYKKIILEDPSCGNK